VDPLINLEETPGKTVGRRRSPADGFAAGMQLQEAVASFGGRRLGVPKGVYRFHSHEEADEWMTTKLAEAAAREKRS
jgi:hypothetical protein